LGDRDRLHPQCHDPEQHDSNQRQEDIEPAHVDPPDIQSDSRRGSRQGASSHANPADQRRSTAALDFGSGPPQITYGGEQSILGPFVPKVRGWATL
jgi:hypothetical protein